MVLGTLVLQGLTLRPLISALELEDDGSVEREVGWHGWRPRELRRAEADGFAVQAIEGDGVPQFNAA